MLTNPKTVKLETNKILKQIGDRKGYIFNLGHGITPDVDPEHVEILIETVHSYP